eukprot:1686468-Rhodomonas_salina.1
MLFFFKKFIDAKFTETTVSETNKAVCAMPTKPCQASLASRYLWPLKWIDTFPNFTVALLIMMQWIAFLLWCGMHKTANKHKLFSTHWPWAQPAVKSFFSRD